MPDLYECDSDEENKLGFGIQNGCEKSFNKLYDTKKYLVFSMAKRRLKDHQISEDVTSIIFFKVWQKAKLWDPAYGNFGAWMNVIAKHSIIDAYRRIEKVTDNEILLLDDNEIDDIVEIEKLTTKNLSIDTPDKHLDSVIFRDVIDNLLPKIANKNQRDCWLMFHIQGLSHTEIAEKTNLNLKNVKILSHRCSVEMRKIIRRHPDYYT